jgi:cytochrome c553
MIKVILLLFPILGALVLSLYSCASDRNSNKALPEHITQCESCHSIDTNISSIAPSLDGMAYDYIVEQLENFRQSKRGIDSTDAFTRDMSQQAKALSDEQISLIADYYSGRTRQLSNESVSGNVENGEHLYKEQCEGCHSSMLGRYFTKSPRITHLRGSYLLAQLDQFSKNKRLMVEDSKHKLKMVAVAKKLNKTEQSNIVAFIKEHYTD